jgi:predicted unusual protein kinase regulating ubiquinone biosynthesis (AarF/ABC1/UbiB family)
MATRATPKKREPSTLARGRAKRVLKVGTLTTSVGSSYIWQALKAPFQEKGKRERELLDTHIRNAMRIVESSKELKGAFMKAVQMLSMRDDILPQEALDVLTIVQSDVPPMSYAEIRTQLVAELGADPKKLFGSFDEEAFAAASLGQVHRATLKSGERVVVKVQYPGVEETVEQDLKNLKALLHTMTLIGRDVMRQDIDQSEIYQELEERLNEELDYVNEARNLEDFRKLFADDDEVLIPRVFPKLSSRRVLTMSEIEGYRFADVLAPGVEQSLKDWVCIKYFRVFWRQVFEFGRLHTDPHPGNYLVTYHPKLAILDFGSIRFFPEPIRRAYVDLAAAMLADDEPAIADALVRLDLIDRVEDAGGWIRIMRIIFEPVLTDRDYDPREFDSLSRAMEIATIKMEDRLFKAPGHPTFLGRALIGLDAYVKQFGTVTNWHRLFVETVKKGLGAGV